jgi:hypothetical protein
MTRRTIVVGAVAVLVLGVGCARQPEGGSVSASTAGYPQYHGDQTITLPRPDVRDYVATANMPDRNQPLTLPAVSPSTMYFCR